MSDEPGEPELVVEQRGGVLIARLNRPEARNALSPALIRAIGSAMNRAEADPDVRVVVITGTGDRAFCSGMDLRAFSGDELLLPPDEAAMAGFMRLINGENPLPVVGAANGSAVAGGFELLLGCDLVVASSDAQFGLPEVKRALIPGGGGTLLGTRVPVSIALEMVLTGDAITAARAYALGLVNAVVERDAVLDTALAYAERIAANGPLAVAAAKELVRVGVANRTRWLERLQELQPIVFSSNDAKEGARAFIEKREPVWRGQ